jgi:hypothetical protein
MSRNGIIGIVNACVVIALMFVLWMRPKQSLAKNPIDGTDTRGTHSPSPTPEQTITSVVGKSEGNLRIVTVRGFHSLMGLQKDANAPNLRTENRRDSNGSVKSVISSTAATSAVELDWSSGKFQVAPKSNPAFFLYPDQQTPPQRMNKISFFNLRQSTKSEGIDLEIRSGAAHKTIPLDKKCIVYTRTAYPEYPIAFGVKRIGEGQNSTEAVLVFDLRTLNIVGEIPLPSDRSNSQAFVLDPATDTAICFDWFLNYAILIDLREKTKELNKPWPPPWPHPAMGPWRGDEERRMNQIPTNGAPVPPRPKDY